MTTGTCIYRAQNGKYGKKIVVKDSNLKDFADKVINAVEEIYPKFGDD